MKTLTAAALEELRRKAVSTREIVQDYVGGERKLGHNPSWIKVADLDAALVDQQDELAEIRAFYDEHAPLDSHEHKTLIQRVRDEWHDFAAVVDHCSEVYDHFSRGRISKPMTLPREAIALAEDFASEDTEEAIKEAREEWEADVAAPAAHQEIEKAIREAFAEGWSCKEQFHTLRQAWEASRAKVAVGAPAAHQETPEPPTYYEPRQGVRILRISRDGSWLEESEEGQRTRRSFPVGAPAPAAEWQDRVIRRVAELPDRTSPEDWPDAMLVTADELRDILGQEV